jgi:iron complex transport system substrate-binding protein
MPDSNRSSLRIASLLASGTEIVCALGLEESLVAISHECDFPPHILDRPRMSRPRFDVEGLDSGAIDRAVREAMAEHGSVYTVDAEALASLKPDLILTQAVCEVCAVPTPGVEKMVAECGLGARVLSLDAHTIEEIFGTIRQVGEACDAIGERSGRGIGGSADDASVDASEAVGSPTGRARSVVASLRSRLENVGRAIAGAPCPRVLAIEWLDPPFAPGHWVPEMIERAGGENLIGKAGGHSHQMAWQDFEGLDPDVLVIMPCGYGLEASVADANQHADRLRSVGGRAIESGCAFVVDGSSYFNRSGPRVVDGVEILAGLIHPDRVVGAPAGRWARWG